MRWRRLFLLPFFNLIDAPFQIANAGLPPFAFAGALLHPCLNFFGTNRAIEGLTLKPFEPIV